MLKQALRPACGMFRTTRPRLRQSKTWEPAEAGSHVAESVRHAERAPWHQNVRSHPLPDDGIHPD